METTSKLICVAFKWLLELLFGWLLPREETAQPDRSTSIEFEFGFTLPPNSTIINTEPSVPLPQIDSDENYNEAIKIVSVAEGGWCHVRGDKGGETVFGVARKYHPKWTGWLIVDGYAASYGRGTPQFIRMVNNDESLKTLAENLFRTIMWMPIRCDSMPREIAIVSFDMAVNSGTLNAAKTLQRTLNSLGSNVSVDGAIGPITLAAINEQYNIDSQNFIIYFLKHRYNFYQRIVKRRPSQKKFWKGWVNRLRRLAKLFVNIDCAFLTY